MFHLELLGIFELPEAEQPTRPKQRKWIRKGMKKLEPKNGPQKKEKPLELPFLQRKKKRITYIYIYRYTVYLSRSSPPHKNLSDMVHGCA